MNITACSEPCTIRMGDPVVRQEAWFITKVQGPDSILHNTSLANCLVNSMLKKLRSVVRGRNTSVVKGGQYGNQILKWKKGYFDLPFTFFSYKGKLQKFLQHISHSHTYMYFAHPIDLLALPILKKKIRIYQVWFLFGMIPGVDSYSRHFGTINK